MNVKKSLGLKHCPKPGVWHGAMTMNPRAFSRPDERPLLAPRAMLDRRRFLSRMTIGAAFFAVPGAFADALTRTPAQTEGPFYPTKLPLDTDNDLLVINDGLTPAVGDITFLSGRILDARGDPLRDALVEIWQCDANGAYLHQRTSNNDKRDQNFQGFGRFMTGSTGEYLFRTIKPVPYPGRTPHIHFAIKMRGRDKFVTQCYIKGHPQNERDGVLRGIRDVKARESVIVPFAPLAGAKNGELAARFDVVMGFTPPA
jgi:protocatechuate 3,4-dioxygenase beta subunit